MTTHSTQTIRHLQQENIRLRGENTSLRDYVEKLHWLCRNINNDLEELWEQLKEFPSIQFGLETAIGADGGAEGHDGGGAGVL